MELTQIILIHCSSISLSHFCEEVIPNSKNFFIVSYVLARITDATHTASTLSEVFGPFGRGRRRALRALIRMGSLSRRGCKNWGRH